MASVREVLYESIERTLELHKVSLVLRPKILSTKFFKGMYGDHSGEFLFGDWGLKG